MNRQIADLLSGWSKEELGNLSALLDIDPTSSVNQIIDSIKWLYYSKTRAGAEAVTRNATGKIISIFTKSNHQHSQSAELRPVPTYDELIVGACRHLKAFDKDASVAELELFLSDAVILAAAHRMKPRQRRQFFEQQIDLSEFTKKARVKGASLGGPATTFALLGVAQASGIGIYIASTTALGFLTHAVGLTLPFAVYTGMTSTIAFLIGPVGWLGAGMWGIWKLTQPKWKKLVPVILCVVANNSRRKLEGSI